MQSLDAIKTKPEINEKTGKDPYNYITELRIDPEIVIEPKKIENASANVDVDEVTKKVACITLESEPQLQALLKAITLPVVGVVSPKRKRSIVKLETKPKITTDPHWLAYLKKLDNKNNTYLWVFSFNRQENVQMGNFYDRVKTELVQFGWFDLGNSSYLKWANTADYIIIANEIAWVLTSKQKVKFITYVSLICASPIPTNHSAQFVFDLQHMLFSSVPPEI